MVVSHGLCIQKHGVSVLHIWGDYGVSLVYLSDQELAAEAREQGATLGTLGFVLYGMAVWSYTTAAFRDPGSTLTNVRLTTH